ncbi:MAG: polyprenol phosphomannose-dependent alpha 1,6 mannosyltransferase MptB [Actinomycetia bacterium]|nr:polyprenol phosphomannose-dependent alpha 1,6 mannosyltransferase MptB [Actinomycetes bacterium]
MTSSTAVRLTVRRTLAHPGLWLGLLGSLLLALGEVRRLAGWSQVRGQSWAGAVARYLSAGQYPALVLAGAVLLGAGWVLLRPGRARPVAPWLVLLVWAVPLLLLPPVLSTDAGSYADLGWMVSHGTSPYETGLGTTGSPFPYGRVWRGTTSVYPPLALELFGLVVRLTGAHWYWSVVALRLLALAGAGLLLWSVPRLARAVGADPGQAVWMAALNPVVLVHGVGGEHIDLLMVGLVAAGLAVARLRHGIVLGSVLIGLAAAVKQPALLAAPAVAGLVHLRAPGRWWHWLARTVAATALAGAAFALVSAATWGFGWVGGSGDPANGGRTLTPAYLLAQLGGSQTTWTLVFQVLAGVVAVAGWAWYGRRQPLRFLALAAAAFVLGFGTFREWYLMLPLAFAGLAGLRRTGTVVVAWLATSLAGYGVLREYVSTPILQAFATSLALGLLALAVAAATRLALTSDRDQAAGWLRTAWESTRARIQPGHHRPDQGKQRAL